MPQTIEILAPAGDEAMLRAAVFSGADCVYLGLRGFNARRTAANFGPRELAEAVAFCHARNCKVYAAVNTLVLPGRQGQLEEAMATVAAAGCDAVIVQDLAALMAAKSVAGNLPVHASTQMSVHSLAGVRQLANMGVSRAILARELCEEEIAAIAAASPIELEVFVHGALCLSVSGQCYASAFLGGRSANRGGCAGPCRLPFRLAQQGEATGTALRPATEDEHALSLKDLSILDALPRLQAMGIAAAKIEGRLRGPEYCAVVVDAARKILNNQEYDKELLQNVFSRSGFTDGWFTGTNGADMFGARTARDTAAAKAALPKARQLYRRERPRVPVSLSLVLGEWGGELTASDGAHVLRRPVPGPLQKAEREGTAALGAALAKLGGTPFYLPDGAAPRVKANGFFLPTSVAAALRREILEELLALRQAPPKREQSAIASAVGMVGGHPGRPLKQQLLRQRAEAGRPALRARFEKAGQIPEEAGACEMLVLPLEEALKLPEELRAKSWLQLPRALFGPAEQAAAKQVEQTRELGFAGYVATNLAHLKLCRGLPLWGGFGLNVANATAAKLLAAWGCVGLTLSPELSLAQLRTLAQDEWLAGAMPLDTLAYGHLPLMLTRACPAKSPQSCKACKGEKPVVDRKGVSFTLGCNHGLRSLYNPVPLWMGDRLDELPTDTATLYFTHESRQQAAGVLRRFLQGQAAACPFTRGLFPKGTEG